ncbi:MAG TPA: flagellar hook-associated protein FlgL [Nevskiaceae bacterium]|nr:flagellar hook-associated protein FlgL [Nevskiaceae bacterium]
MRISTSMMYALQARGIDQQQSALMHVGDELASGQSVTEPSDNPLAAAESIVVGQNQALTTQYTAARSAARSSLSTETNALNAVVSGIQSAQSLLVEASNGTLNNADRAASASQLQTIENTLLSQANATGPDGGYIFGGYANSSPPFVTAGGGSISYVGDDNAASVQVGVAQQVQIQDNGSTVFSGAAGVSGYEAVAGSGNTGSLTFATPSIVDSTAPGAGTPFVLQFAVNGGTTTYSVESPTGTALQGPTAYTSGQPITYAGVQLSLAGTAANGDTIDVSPAATTNTNVFTTLQKAVQALKAPVGTAAQQAAQTDTLNDAMQELAEELGNVLTVQASVGSRLNELTVMDTTASQQQVSDATQQSNLTGLDYAQAVSQYSLIQTGLQAAEKTFADMQGMSLFNVLPA